MDFTHFARRVVFLRNSIPFYAIFQPFVYLYYAYDYTGVCVCSADYLFFHANMTAAHRIGSGLLLLRNKNGRSCSISRRQGVHEFIEFWLSGIVQPVPGFSSIRTTMNERKNCSSISYSYPDENRHTSALMIRFVYREYTGNALQFELSI